MRNLDDLVPQHDFSGMSPAEAQSLVLEMSVQDALEPVMTQLLGHVYASRALNLVSTHNITRFDNLLQYSEDELRDIFQTRHAGYVGGIVEACKVLMGTIRNL